MALSHFHLFHFYFENIEDYGKAEGYLLDYARIIDQVHGPAYSALGNSYDWLITLYQTTEENEVQKKKDEWEKLQERKDNEEEDNEMNKEEKQKEEITLEELIKFVTVSDTIEP